MADHATEATKGRGRSVMRVGEATTNGAAEAGTPALGPSATRRVVLRRLGAGLVGLAFVGMAPRHGRAQEPGGEESGAATPAAPSAASPGASPIASPVGSAMKRDLVVTRVFDAPVELVWRAWSDPEHLMRWWGPTGFTSPRCEMDFREGGTTLVCMSSPQYGDLYHTWTYREIVPLRRIEFVQSPADEHGQRVDPVAAGMPPDVPPEVRHVVTFEAAGGETEMTVTEYGYTSEQTLEISRAGMEQCLDKMAASVAGA